MLRDDKNPQSQHACNKSEQQQNTGIQKQRIKTTINSLIQRIQGTQMEWKKLTPDILQLSKYFTNHQPLQQMNKLLRLLVNKYQQKGELAWLELFDNAMLSYQTKLQLQQYRSFILQITYTLSTYTLQVCQKDNNNNIHRQHLHKQIQKQYTQQEQQQKSQATKYNRQELQHQVQESQHQLIQNLQNMQLDSTQQIKPNIDIQMCRHWKLYIDLIKSYAYQCLSHDNTDHVWIFYDIVLILLLNCHHVQVNTNVLGQKVVNIINNINRIIQGRYIQPIYHNFFHQICLFLRVFISRPKQFLQKPSKIIKQSDKVPMTNNCSLMMRFVQKQFTDQHITLTTQHKLDCMMLLTSIVTLKLPKSVNYNQVLEFALQIVLYVDQQQQHINNKNISQLIFYCGQLLSMIMYNNIDWVVQFCRKTPEHIDNKYLRRVLKIYKRGLQHLNINLTNQEHQIYVYIRYILGFCGLMKLQKMDTYVQDAIRDDFPLIVRVMEVIHGWDQQQQQQQYHTQHIKQQISQHKPMQMQQQFMQKSPKNMQCQPKAQNPAQYILWSEQFYNKNNLVYMEDIDQIDIFKKSMIAVKIHNPPLFEQLLNNFTEKQIMMWVVELENQADQDDDY